MPNRIRELRLGLVAKFQADVWSVTAVARYLGIDPTMYRRWEAGTARPRPRNAARLAALLQVTIEDLGLDDEAHSAQPAKPE